MVRLKYLALVALLFTCALASSDTLLHGRVLKSSKGPKSAKSSKAPKTTKAPKAPKEPKSSKGPKSSKTPNSNHGGRVAIIGGGATGILSARELIKLNYEVTIYEASDRIGGLSTTLEHGGLKYDMSTIFMSSGDFMSPGLNVDMENILRDAGLEQNVEPWTGVTKQLVNGNIVEFLPPNIIIALQKGEGQIILNEIFTGLGILERITVEIIQGVAAVKSSNIDIDIGETFNEWADRVGAGYLRDFLEVLTNAAMGGPSGDAAAAYILNQRARLGPSAIANLVLFVMNFMERGSQTPDLSSAPLTFVPLIMRGPYYNWIGFDKAHGFQDLWKSLVKGLGINVSLNRKVEKIGFDSGHVSINIGGIAEYYDAVILATPPYATASILSSSTGLLSATTDLATDFAIVPRDHSVITVAVKADSERVFSEGYGSVITSVVPNLDTPISLAKQYSGSDTVEITGIYSGSKCADVVIEDYSNIAKTFLEDSLKNYMYNVTEVIAIKCFDAWPYRPSIEMLQKGFIERIEAAQGKGGVFFSGEILTGVGIASIAQYVTYSIPKHFPFLPGNVE